MPITISENDGRYQNKDFSDQALRQIQLKRYEAGEIDKVADESNGGKSLQDLKKIWAPMILDKVGSQPWTREEILKAMETPLRQISRKWAARGRSSTSQFDEDDAYIEAMTAVLDAIHTDKGKSPFAPYAITHASRAVQRARRKQSDIIGGPIDKKGYTGRVNSLHAPTGVSPRDIIHNIGEQPIIDAMICPRCDGKGQIVPEGGVKPRACPSCGGSGKVPVSQPKSEVSNDPSEKASSREKVMVQQKFLDYILDIARQAPYNMTPQQETVLRLRFNLDGNAEDSERAFPDIAKVMTAAEEIDAIRNYAKEQDKVDEFEKIIVQHLDSDALSEFKKNTAIGITSLFSTSATDQGTQQAATYGGLIDELRTTFTDQFKRSQDRSKKGTRDLFVKTMDKLQKIRQANQGVQDFESQLFKTYSIKECNQCFANLFQYSYYIILEEISRGIACIEDIEQLAYIF